MAATEALKELELSELLVQDNVDVVMNHAKPAAVAKALCKLNHRGILMTKSEIKIADTLQKLAPLSSFNSYELVTINGALRELQWKKLLTQGNIDALEKLQHDELLNVTRSLTALADNKLLTQDNIDVVMNHAEPKVVTQALCELNKGKILVQDNKMEVVRHAKPDDLAKVLCELNEHKILTPANREIAANHVDIGAVRNALIMLSNRLLLTKESFAVVKHEKPVAAVLLLYQINKFCDPNKLNAAAALLEPERRIMLVAECPEPECHTAALLDLERLKCDFDTSEVLHHNELLDLIGALVDLGPLKLLTQENFETLVSHAEPVALAKALDVLRKSRLLTQENFETLVNHAEPVVLAEALGVLRKLRILKEQDNFNECIKPGAAANVVAVRDDEAICYLEKLAKMPSLQDAVNFRGVMERIKTDGFGEIWSEIKGQVALRLLDEPVDCEKNIDTAGLRSLKKSFSSSFEYQQRCRCMLFQILRQSDQESDVDISLQQSGQSELSL